MAVMRKLTYLEPPPEGDAVGVLTVGLANCGINRPLEMIRPALNFPGIARGWYDSGLSPIIPA